MNAETHPTSNFIPITAKPLAGNTTHEITVIAFGDTSDIATRTHVCGRKSVQTRTMTGTR